MDPFTKFGFPVLSYIESGQVSGKQARDQNSQHASCLFFLFHPFPYRSFRFPSRERLHWVRKEWQVPSGRRVLPATQGPHAEMEEKHRQFTGQPPLTVIDLIMTAVP